MDFLTSNVLLFSIIANFFVFVRFIPTVVATVKNRNNFHYAKNLDNGQLLIMVLNQVAWIWYAALFRQPLIAAFVIVEIPITIYLFYMKNIKFRKMVYDTGEEIHGGNIDATALDINDDVDKHTSIGIKEKVGTKYAKNLFVYVLSGLFVVGLFTIMFTNIETEHIVGVLANCYAFSLFVPTALSTYAQRDDREFVSNVSNVQSIILLCLSFSWIIYGLALESVFVTISTVFNIPIAIFLLYVKNVRARKDFDDGVDKSSSAKVIE